MIKDQNLQWKTEKRRAIFEKCAVKGQKIQDKR
jgi:hypothetical protein